MIRPTQASGVTVRQTGKVSLCTQMEISTRVPGSMINLTATEPMIMQMELDMSANGRKTSNMARVTRHG